MFGLFQFLSDDKVVYRKRSNQRGLVDHDGVSLQGPDSRSQPRGCHNQSSHLFATASTQSVSSPLSPVLGGEGHQGLGSRCSPSFLNLIPPPPPPVFGSQPP